MEKTTMTDTDHAQTEFEQGLMSARAGDYRRAVDAFTKVIDAAPDNAIAYFNRGVARKYATPPDQAGALSDFAEAIRLNPQLADAYHQRGLIRTHTGDIDGALADYGEAIHFYPNDPMLYFHRAIAYSSKGEITALADFDEAIRLNPGFVEAYVMRGNVRGMLGQFDEAIDDLKHALRLRPDHPQAALLRIRIEDLELFK